MSNEYKTVYLRLAKFASEPHFSISKEWSLKEYKFGMGTIAQTS